MIDTQTIDTRSSASLASSPTTPTYLAQVNSVVSLTCSFLPLVLFQSCSIPRIPDKTHASSITSLLPSTNHNTITHPPQKAVSEIFNARHRTHGTCTTSPFPPYQPSNFPESTSYRPPRPSGGEFTITMTPRCDIESWTPAQPIRNPSTSRNLEKHVS
jgi:hypothetical protein